MHDGPKRDAQAIAEDAARVFSAEDRGTFFIGSELVSIGPGRAVVRLKIHAHHLNSAKVCHGGFVFALADSALGFASCSHGVQTLAQHADIHWLKPGREGDTLTATATERVRYGRSGVYDVTVRRGDEVIAEFRGRSRTTG